MKSAYGLKIPEPDPELTHVGPGTACGELMRRYWQPVCLSADLTDLPKPVKVLGEDLIAFRDGQERAGLLFFRCSHRSSKDRCPIRGPVHVVFTDHGGFALLGLLTASTADRLTGVVSIARGPRRFPDAPK